MALAQITRQAEPGPQGAGPLREGSVRGHHERIVKERAGRAAPHDRPVTLRPGGKAPLVAPAVQPAAVGRPPIAWRNDFDWAGLRITAGALDRVGARPWRMSEADYVAALATGDTEPLRGKPAPSPWDPGLAAALAATGRSVMEERLVASLLADLGAAAVPVPNPDTAHTEP